MATPIDRKSTRLNSSHLGISYAVFCLKKKMNVGGRLCLNTPRHTARPSQSPASSATSRRVTARLYHLEGGGAHCGSSPFLFFNDTATTEIYTLSLRDALPIWTMHYGRDLEPRQLAGLHGRGHGSRSEEHTSELQSLRHLVCRLLLEKN